MRLELTAALGIGGEIRNHFQHTAPDGVTRRPPSTCNAIKLHWSISVAVSVAEHNTCTPPETACNKRDDPLLPHL
jgi:hypothetical protein